MFPKTSRTAPHFDKIVKRRNSLHILSITFIALILISFFLLYVQGKESLRPLINGNDIFVNNTLHIYKPDPRSILIPPRILDLSLMQENLSKQGEKFVGYVGTIETKPFRPSRYMSIPLLGGLTDGEFSGQFFRDKARIVLKCLDSGAEIDLMRAPSESWYMRTVRIPDNWCRDSVQVIGQSKLENVRIGIGTPIKVGPLFWISSSWVGAMAAGILAAGLFCLIFIPILSLKKTPLLLRLLMGILYPSVSGYLLYMQAQAAQLQPYLWASSIVFFVLPCVGLIGAMVRDKQTFDAEVVSQFCWGLAGCLLIIVLPYTIIHLDNGFWFPNYAFYPVTWSKDNHLSLMMAKYAVMVGGGHPEYLGSWSISDRGIIQAGTLTPLIALLSTIKTLNNAIAITFLLHFFSAFLQSLAIPVGVIFIKNFLYKDVRSWKITVLLSTTPFILMNSFFVWPKLYAGLLAVTAAIAFSVALRSGRASIFCAGLISFVFGMMNHSAGSMMALAVFMYVLISLTMGFHKLSDIWRLLASGKSIIVITLLLCVGLIKSETMIEPATSWPSTYVLTGSGTFGLSPHEIIEKIYAFYAGTTLQNWITLKIGLLTDLVWIEEQFFARVIPGASFLGAIRTRECFSLLPALGPGLMIALLVAMSCQHLRFLRCEERQSAIDAAMLNTVMIFAVSCLMAILTMVLFFNMPMIIPHVPYGAILGILLALACMALQRPILFNIAVSISVLNCAIVWFGGAWYTWYVEVLK
jgi:hypothetical protein